MNVCLLNNVRNKILQYSSLKLHETVEYWLQQIIYSVDVKPSDLLFYAVNYYDMGHYQRTVDILEIHQLDTKYFYGAYLKLLCMEKMFYKYRDKIIHIENIFENLNIFKKLDDNTFINVQDNQIQSGLLFLCGNIYFEASNSMKALVNFQESLRSDILNHDSYNRIFGSGLMTKISESEALENLPYEEQTTNEAERNYLINNYQDKSINNNISLSMNLKRHIIKLINGETTLQTTPLIFAQIVNICKFYITMYCFEESQLILNVLKRQNGIDSTFAILQSTIFCETNQKLEMYEFAHYLVKKYVRCTDAWYCVALYFFLIKDYTNCRRFLFDTCYIFSKIQKYFTRDAKTIYLCGRSYEEDKEFDQSILFYLLVKDILPGCYLSHLHLAMDYRSIKYMKASNTNLYLAESIAEGDPYFLNELGVLYFQAGKYQKALDSFKKVTKVLNTLDVINIHWEAIYSNIGHIYRKFGRYDLALKYFFKSLKLNEINSDLLASIGFVYLCKLNLKKALFYFHKAYSFDKKNVFITSIIHRIIQDNYKYNEIGSRQYLRFCDFNDESCKVNVEFMSKYLNENKSK
ncbi:hypothetical protein A3Q56_03106 [Intoshia linei]|uniref:Uncharacterized protein n=1 Tax=Intoshia linei TaxID=1819745 RepID=A0A177B676_9BILA|nr:hypothetical protein A3Q56_03106 [Intoshia linei]